MKTVSIALTSSAVSSTVTDFIFGCGAGFTSMSVAMFFSLANAKSTACAEERNEFIHQLDIDGLDVAHLDALGTFG